MLFTVFINKFARKLSRLRDSGSAFSFACLYDRCVCYTLFVAERHEALYSVDTVGYESDLVLRAAVNQPMVSTERQVSAEQ